MAKHWLQAIMLLLYGIMPTLASAADTEPQNATPDPDPKTLRFVVYYPDFPPYIFTDSAGHISGIVPDLLAPFFTQQQISVDYLLDNRAGAEQRLYRGEVDAMMLSPDWATRPEQVIFSDSIIAYDDYFFARSVLEVAEKPEQLTGKKVCTREFYVYPALEPLFSSGQLLRVDASSQEAQLRMVLSKRCDLAYLNDLVANWLLINGFSGERLYPLPLFIGKSGLTIALNPKWQTLLSALNYYLQQQQDNGEVQRVIARYLP
jgi:polar amino acid transport system substrate-binding protein